MYGINVNVPSDTNVDNESNAASMMKEMMMTFA